VSVDTGHVVAIPASFGAQLLQVWQTSGTVAIGLLQISSLQHVLFKFSNETEPQAATQPFVILN